MCHIQSRYAALIYEGFCNNSNTPLEIKEKTSLELLNKVLYVENNEIVPEEVQLEVEAYVAEVSPLLPAESKKSSKRYRAEPKFPNQQVIKWIFNQSFEQNSKSLITLAEAVKGNGETFYPKWKQVCWIDATKISASLFANKAFKLVTVIATAALTVFAMYCVYVEISPFTGREVILAIVWMTGMCSLQVISGTVAACEKVSKGFQRVSDNAARERMEICKYKCLEVWKASYQIPVGVEV